jgi:predicted nucleic acid-binding protein
VEYLIDSSVWVEFLNGRPGKARETVRELVQEPQRVVVTEPVLMEIRAGVVESNLAKIEKVLERFALRSVEPVRDFHAASELYRATRQRGCTVRSMIDCLIAAVAIRTGITVLHRDRDFDVLAETAPRLRCWSTVD